MKYIAKNQNYVYVSDSELLELLLRQRGVEDVEAFLNLNENVVHDGMLLNNMEYGCQLLAWHVNNGSRIHVIIDSDADGFTAAAFMYQYLTDLGVEATYSTHMGKEHGITPNAIDGFEFDLLIVPDAGTNDVEMCEQLRAKDVDVIILDHHKIEVENPYACVINNQDGYYPNPTLSGVGVVYKFCKEFDKMYGFDFADHYLDLVALGVIGDSMDLRNLETRYLTLKGLEAMGTNNEFIKEVIIEQAFSIGDELTMHGVGWYVAPLVNGLIRGGTYEEKIRLFEALAGFKADVEYKPRKSAKNPNPQVEIQTLQKAMVRVCKSVKGKQDREIKKSVEKVVCKIEDENIIDEKMIVVDVTDILSQTLTGLVANKLASQFKRPVVLLRDKKEDESMYGGSCRNYSRFAIDDLQSFLMNTGYFEGVNGHSNAAGVSIPKDNIDGLREHLTEELKDVTLEDWYHVDYEIPVGRLKEKHVLQVGQWKSLWANTLQEPTFAITDIFVNSDEIKLLGEKKNIIKFDVTRGDNKISFIKRFASEELYNKIIHRSSRGLAGGTKKLKLTVIGKFTINNFNGKQYPQVEIVDILSEVQTNKRVLF